MITLTRNAKENTVTATLHFPPLWTIPVAVSVWFIYTLIT